MSVLPHDVDHLSDGIEYCELDAVVIDDEDDGGEERQQPSQDETDDPPYYPCLQRAFTAFLDAFFHLCVCALLGLFE